MKTITETKVKPVNEKSKKAIQTDKKDPVPYKKPKLKIKEAFESQKKDTKLATKGRGKAY